MTLHADIQQPDLNKSGGRVELFELDATVLGGSITRFCSSVYEGTALTWQGNVYSPLPVEASGFEVSGGSSLPTPSLTLSDGLGLFRDMIRTYNDLVGAKVTRTVTFRKYLDGMPDASPTEYFPQDIYYVERKVRQQGAVIEWELSALMDQQGKKLPGRTIMKVACDYRYRIWDTETAAFDYTDVTCPYTGTRYFTEAGAATPSTTDACGHKLSDCVLRYLTAPLPFHGFPGVSHVRN